LDFIRRDNFVTDDDIPWYNHGQDDQLLYDECERHAAIIRKMIIVTLIMEYIRRLSENSKLDLRQFCDAVVKAEHNNNKLIYDKVFQKYNLSNQSRVESVTSLKIKHIDHAIWLKKWYDMTVTTQNDGGNPMKEEVEGNFFNVLKVKLEAAIICGGEMRQNKQKSVLISKDLLLNRVDPTK
jgi:hypothetical protein